MPDAGSVSRSGLGTRTSRWLLVVLIGAGVAVTACGGGDRSAGGPPSERAGADRVDAAAESGVDSVLLSRADSLAHSSLLVDANILTPYRMTLDTASIWGETGWGEFDYPRARRGGLDLAVMGMLIPNGHEEAGDAVEVAGRRLDEWHDLVRDHPDRFELIARSTDLDRARRPETVGLLLAIENGIAIGEDTAGVRALYERGVRLITLVHSRPNRIGDSSYSEERPWNGLSPFGQDAVRAMNDHGMIVDVSHMSDSTVFDVLAVSRTPVVASHSSVRAFTPGWERNVSDDLIRAIADAGGVIHLVFGGSFLSSELQAREQPMWDHVEQSLGLSINSVRGRAEAMAYRARNDVARGTVRDLADHVDHVVSLVGMDHVGIGSGFDGSGDSMLADLRDVSGYPALLAELMLRGYSDADLERLMAGNFLRVWRAVEEARIHEPR